jgi:hypothetical protein
MALTAEVMLQGSASVTSWRAELETRRAEIAEFILAHAEPEAAMRLAQDTAHDLAHAVKQKLRAVHGRTFDPLFDYQPPPPTYKFRPDPSLVRIMAAVTETPGITATELTTLPGLASWSSVCVLLPMLVREGRLRREGTGGPGGAFRYYPAAQMEAEP